MADLHQTVIHHIARRLEEATWFSGQLKCSFDPSMPLNITDLTQPFLMTCKSPPTAGMPGWVIALIVIGSIIGPFVVLGLGYYMYVFICWCEKTRKEYRRRKQLAAEEAARNDYVKA